MQSKFTGSAGNLSSRTVASAARVQARANLPEWLASAGAGGSTVGALLGLEPEPGQGQGQRLTVALALRLAALPVRQD